MGKAKNLCISVIVKVMDNLIDDWPLTYGGKTIFELIDNCLPNLIGD